METRDLARMQQMDITDAIKSDKGEIVRHSVDVNTDVRYVYLTQPYEGRLPTQTDLEHFSKDGWELVTILKDEGPNPFVHYPFVHSGVWYKAYFKKLVHVIDTYVELKK